MIPVAVDISDTIIRLVALEHHGHNWKIKVRAEIPVLAGLVTDGDIQQPEQVVALLKLLVTAADTKAKDVAVSLPERHTFVKLISLPANSRGHLEEAIATALTQHIPYTIDEVYWDWHLIDQKNSLGELQVLIGAAPRTTVDEYLGLFSQASLRVDEAEIESLAIIRGLFGPEPPDDTRIVVDLGRTRSTIILVDHGVVQFSSTLRYAGRELNRFISDELHISAEQAERAKTLFGLDPKRGKGLLRTVLAPHIEAIADGITGVENFFQEHYVDHRPVTKIHLTGSGALLRNIDVELQARLKQEVVIEPSWLYTELKKTHHDLPPELGYSYTTVFGLAARAWFPSS